MDSRKPVLLLLFILMPCMLTAYETTLMRRYLADINDHLTWKTQGDEEPELKVARYRNGQTLWSYTTADISVFLDDHKFPQTAYALYGDVVTFPVSTEEADSGALRRRQIGLDAQTGELLWEKELYCGITQAYFYSWSDADRLYIHNIHEYKGSQLVCLDLKSGETLWETEGLPQPALPVETKDSLILHSGLVREFIKIDKEHGTIRRHETSSPVQIWRDRPLFLRKSGDYAQVITLHADGSEEVLFQIPNNDENRIYSYQKDPFDHFFKVLHKPILNWAVYRDSLIFQKRTSNGLSILTACSLAGRGEILWEIPLPEGREFQLKDDYSSFSMYMNTGNSFVLLGLPDTAVFYQLENRYLPLFVRDSRYSTIGVAVIDLEEGRTEFVPDELSGMGTYIFQTLHRSGDNYYYFLQRYSESSEGSSLVLKLDGGTGKFTMAHHYDNNIPDADKWWKNPYLFLYQHSMDVLTWENISEDLKSQLLVAPGLSSDAF